MKPTPAHYAAARAKYFALKESGKSPTADPERYIVGIAEAVLAVPRAVGKERRSKA